MPLNKLLQKDYTLSSLCYQIKLPLDIEIIILADDPVRLLSSFVEGMELIELYKTYGKIKKNQASPRQLFKIIVYASINRIYSSRDIDAACHRDINLSTYGVNFTDEKIFIYADTLWINTIIELEEISDFLETFQR